MPVISLVNPAGGSTWSATGSLSAPRHALASTGVQSAALAIAGLVSSVRSATTEKFDGSTWSAGVSISEIKDTLGAAGTQSAALAFGGNKGSGFSAVTQKFDGSAWSATGNLLAPRAYVTGAGTQSAALAFGGYTTNYTATTEKFDGSVWSATGNLSVAKHQVAGAGTQNAGLVMGGYASNALSAVTEKFDGSTWSTTADMSMVRMGAAGAGTQSAALVFGGTAGLSNSHYATAAVAEKFNGSTWSTTATLGTSRGNTSGAGTQNAGLAIGGYTGGTAPTATVEKFIGNSYTGPHSLSVAEGVLANGNIATLSASEAGMTFSLVAGTGSTDNASFQISGSNLNTLSALDYETKNSYSIRINATNGTTTYQNEVSISVTNVNEAPSNINLSASSIQENNAVNAVIGTLSAIDPDTGDTSFTFSITGGADQAKFNISGSSLRASEVFNYEVPADANGDNVYSVDITATDAGGLTYTKSFSISVTNDTSDDSIAVPSSTVLTDGKVAIIAASNPTSIPFLLNGSALPIGSVVRWSGNSNQKFVKKSGSSTAFTAIPLTAPAEWKWDAGGQAAWDVLQSI